jgi:integrase
MYYPALSDKKRLTITFAKEIPKYLTADEVQHILASVSNKARDHLLISMLWQTGARVSELLNVRVKDVDFYARTIQLHTLKRRIKTATRTLPLQDGLKGDIGAYIAMKGLKKDDQLFPIVRQTAYFIVNRAATGTGFEKDRAHPHIFRHSFAVHCILSSIPVVVLQQWLGHASIQNTLIYLQVLGRDTRHFFDGLTF